MGRLSPRLNQKLNPVTTMVFTIMDLINRSTGDMSMTSMDNTEETTTMDSMDSIDTIDSMDSIDIVMDSMDLMDSVVMETIITSTTPAMNTNSIEAQKHLKDFSTNSTFYYVYDKYTCDFMKQ